MNNSSSIHLDGTVVWCKARLIDDGDVLANVALMTLSPSALSSWDKPSEAFDKHMHRVVVHAGGEAGKDLLRLQEMSRRGISGILPYSVDGRLLAQADGTLLVECDGKGFVPCPEDTLKTSGNNVATLVGTVSESPTFTDSSATIPVNTSVGPMYAVVSRTANEEWWRRVAAQAVKKGMKINLSGSILSTNMTNGKETIPANFIKARKIVEIVRKKTKSQTL